MILSTHSEPTRDVTEISFSRAWTTILAERQDAPNGGTVRGYQELPAPGDDPTMAEQAARAPYIYALPALGVIARTCRRPRVLLLRHGRGRMDLFWRGA